MPKTKKPNQMNPYTCLEWKVRWWKMGEEKESVKGKGRKWGGWKFQNMWNNHLLRVLFNIKKDLNCCISVFMLIVFYHGLNHQVIYGVCEVWTTYLSCPHTIFASFIRIPNQFRIHYERLGNQLW